MSLGTSTSPALEAFGPMHQDRPVASLAFTFSGTEHQRNPRSPQPQVLGRSRHSLWSLNRCPEAKKKQDQALASAPRPSCIPDPRAKFQPCSSRPGQTMSQFLLLPVPKVASHSLSLYDLFLYCQDLIKAAKREVGFILVHGFRRISMNAS